MVVFMFLYSLDNKRYHTLNYFYKQKFGKKVFKISLNMGLTCPNKVNGSGCIFCSNSSGDFAGNPYDDIATQFETIKSMMEKKWPDAYYIGYFQAGTNTYAPLEVLKKNYEEVLKQIVERDRQDSNRAVAPLKRADDAVVIDTSHMTAEEVAATICKAIQQKI